MQQNTLIGKQLNILLLLNLMLVGFLDICNFFMPIPIYAPLFLSHTFLQGASEHYKSILLGFAIASYGVAQLFGGPILGGASDQYGRKKTLLASQGLSMLGCLAGGVSLTYHYISLLFVSRLMLGFASGTIAIAMAIASDYSDDLHRAKNIGYINIGIAMGVVLGPIIGGHFAVRESISIFGYATPFYLVSALYVINIILLLFLLPNQNSLNTRVKPKLFIAFKNLYFFITRSTKLRSLIIIMLLFQIGIESFYLTAPILATKYLQMTSDVISNHFMLQGCTAILILSLNSYLASRFPPKQIFLAATLLVCISMSFLPININKSFFLIPFIGLGCFATLSWTYSNTLFSLSVNESEQGLIFGISQALWSIGGIIGSIAVGLTSPILLVKISLIPLGAILASTVCAFILLK